MASYTMYCLLPPPHDSVYAFDADGNNPADGHLWRVSLLGRGETYVSFEDVNTTDIKTCHWAFVGTPVIARSNGTLYVCREVQGRRAATLLFKQRLHALNLADGTEKTTWAYADTSDAARYRGWGVNRNRSIRC